MCVCVCECLSVSINLCNYEIFVNSNSVILKEDIKKTRDSKDFSKRSFMESNSTFLVRLYVCTYIPTYVVI